jgi:hypothetical protein
MISNDLVKRAGNDRWPTSAPIQLPKLNVVGSIPIARSNFPRLIKAFDVRPLIPRFPFAVSHPGSAPRSKRDPFLELSHAISDRPRDSGRPGRLGVSCIGPSCYLQLEGWLAIGSPTLPMSNVGSKGKRAALRGRTLERGRTSRL